MATATTTQKATSAPRTAGDTLSNGVCPAPLPVMVT
jgi:hypothetical protein